MSLTPTRFALRLTASTANIRQQRSLFTRLLIDDISRVLRVDACRVRLVAVARAGCSALDSGESSGSDSDSWVTLDVIPDYTSISRADSALKRLYAFRQEAEVTRERDSTKVVRASPTALMTQGMSSFSKDLVRVRHLLSQTCALLYHSHIFPVRDSADAGTGDIIWPQQSAPNEALADTVHTRLPDLQHGVVTALTTALFIPASDPVVGPCSCNRHAGFHVWNVDATQGSWVQSTLSESINVTINFIDTSCLCNMSGSE